MEIIKNKTDRFKLSEFYKGSETDPTYVFVQQFNDKKLNSENKFLSIFNPAAII